MIFWADKRFTAESIRASEVWAEHTSANVISAGNATVGRESRIGLVQYSGTYSAIDGAVGHRGREGGAERLGLTPRRASRRR